MSKTCKGCDVTLPAGQRVWCGRVCKDKHYNRKQRLKLTKFKQEYKMSKGCAVCGYNKHPAALHFDHIDPTTKECELGDNTVSMPRILKEIEKCQVLCANCHAEKTWENRNE